MTSAEGGPGARLADMTNNARFPDSPDSREYLTQWGWPGDEGSNYGARLYGWLSPPADGDY